MPHNGASIEQDPRYKDKQKKLKESLKFPSVYSHRVDMKKVNMDIMRPWITTKIYNLLGFEDEIIPEYVFSLLEQSQFPDPKDMQINLTGFLEKNSAKFMNELWKLLVDAQDSISGIPSVFIEEKKKELLERQVESEKIKLEIHRRRHGHSPSFN